MGEEVTASVSGRFPFTAHVGLYCINSIFITFCNKCSVNPGRQGKQK